MDSLYLETVIVTAISAWALVEWSRPLLKMLKIQGPKKRLVLRSIALIVGAIAGSLLHPDFYPKGTADQGFFIGLGCGAFNALIVNQIKTRAKALKGKSNGD